MAKNVNGVQINQTVTIAEKMGAAVDDVRNLILKYDTNGNAVLATDGTAVPIGISLIESGYNDVTGVESGKIAVGDDIEIQVKDIGYVIAGEAISKGDIVTAGTGGKAAVASSGDYALGVALGDASANGYVRVQICKFKA